MLIENYGDIDKLYTRIRQGDILIICNIHRNITKYYWFLKGLFMISYNDGEYADYCYPTEFRRDLVMALKSEDFTVSLMTNNSLEVIYQIGNLV